MPRLTLTFDNGPTPGVTEAVLDVLAERDIKSTFFVIGEKVATDAGHALAARARAEGHWLGNHTMTHGQPLGLVGDPTMQVAEISQAEAALGSLVMPERFFRPTGHGSIGPHLLSRTAADLLVAEKYTMVLWSLFVRDSKMPDGWVERAVDRLPERDWHVLVLHDLPSDAMASLPRFLDAAHRLGYGIVQDFPLDCTPLVRGRAVPDFEALYVTPRHTAPMAGEC